MRVATLLLVSALAWPAASIGPEAVWISADGASRWKTPLDRPASPGNALKAAPAFPPFPDLDIELADGATFATASARGKVVLLDVWASWCGPCLTELPHLQKLWAAESSSGLAAIAVNANESVDVARETARKLGLTMPIGLYSGAVDDALAARKLPTLVLLDKLGRVRARWDGYSPGLETIVAARVRSLLAGDPEGSPREIARADAGDEPLDVAWTIDLGARPSGIAVDRTGGGTVSVVAAAGDQLALVAANGSSMRKIRVPSSSWRLAAVPEANAGGVDLLAWRPGAAEVLSIDLEKGQMRRWSAPTPIFDVAVAPGGGKGSPPRVLAATLEGLVESDPSGVEVSPSENKRPLLGVSIDPAGGVRTVLEQDGVLRSSGKSLGAVSGARSIVAVNGGAVALPAGVIAYTSGRFFSGGKRQIAVATASGRLFLLDDSGRARFAATWPDLASLAAGDLDGDGRDELIVGAGHGLAALRAPDGR